MGNKSKKILSFVAALACLSSTAMFASCGKVAYKGDELGEEFVKDADVESNGGFAVVKGDYVYFINGAEDYTAKNVYGDVVKGALMRISKTDLANRNFTSETVKTVVPSLFVAQNFNAGIYIYGDTVYYATPTTRKNTEGEVENSYIDFKSAKLDGSEGPMKNYYLDLASNSANYRFVEVGEGENKTVYLLFEEDGALKSYNTKKEETTTLVSGDNIKYYYDTTDPENANVYYTMSVPGLTLDSSALSYNQLYCVNAAATVTSVDAKNASYTVSNGKTYSFNKAEMEEKNNEAKENKAKELPYDFNDYTTYPYVNLGDLVLDGVGINNKNDDNGQPTRTTQYNENTDSTPSTLDGYTYEITGYANGGVYFTQTDGTKTGSDGESTKLYYLADSVSAASAWNVVLGNDSLDVVAKDTTNTANAKFYFADVDNDNVDEHMYLYKSGTELYRGGYDSVNGEMEAVRLAKGLPSADTDFKFLDLDGKYLYYSATESNVSRVYRMDYTGEKYSYSTTFENTDAYADYQATALAYVELNSAWYAPEIIGDTLLYSNAKAFGSTAYNYVYAAKLGADNLAIKADNKAYDAPLKNIESEEYNYNADLQTALEYYYYSGETTAFDNVRDEYVKDLQDAFDGFVAKFTAAAGATPTYQKLSTFTALLGKMTEADTEAIEEDWADTLRSPKADEDKEEFPTWAIVLIIAGSVVVIAAAAGGVLLYLRKKKKVREAEAEATVNAYKRKIDVTDDKNIDVYADDEESADTQEAEETQETADEAAEEQPAEEAAEEAEKDE